MGSDNPWLREIGQFVDRRKLDRFDPAQTKFSAKEEEEHLPLFPQRSASLDEEKYNEMQLIGRETPSVRMEIGNVNNPISLLRQSTDRSASTHRTVQRRLA